MSQYEMGGRKALKVVQPKSTGKENQTPKKSKHVVSVAGLFNQQHRLKQKRKGVARDVLSPRSAGVSKPSTARADVYSQGHGGKSADSYSLFNSFADATRDYRDGAIAYRSEQLYPVYSDLMARVNGLDATGNQLGHASISSKAEAHALAQEINALSKPIGEEEITLQIAREGGAMESKDIKLKDTIHAFQRMTDQKRAELTHHLQQLQDMDVEIAAAKQEIVRTEDGDVKKAKEDSKAALAALAKEAKACKEMTIAEVSQARKQDKTLNLETNRKVEEFMKALQ